MAWSRYSSRAIRQVADHYEAWIQANQVHFLFVGDGLKMAEVKEILGETSSKSSLLLTGLVPQDQAPAYLAASNVLLSTARC